MEALFEQVLVLLRERCEAAGQGGSECSSAVIGMLVGTECAVCGIALTEAYPSAAVAITITISILISLPLSVPGSRP